MKLVTVEEMQAIEREANERGWSYDQMMERAGQGLAEIVQSFYGYEDTSVVVGLVGSGNNGGDTLIALEKLALEGWQAQAYLVRPRAKGDPLLARLQKAGGAIITAAEDIQREMLRGWLAEATVVLDGVLGTGVRLPLKVGVAEVLAFVKAFQPLPDVVAVDCPSGVDLDSGEAAEQAIKADVTVSMAAVKTGLLRFPAYGLAGTLEVVDIGLPQGLASWEKIRSETVTEETVRAILPVRPPDGHKGTFGTVGVAAGSLNFTGAAFLCSAAAYRIGAGLVQIAAPAPLHAALAGQIPEATWVLLPHELGVIAENAADVLSKHLEKVDVLLWGPGFGLEDPTAGFVRRLVEGRGGKARSKGIGFVAAAGEPTSPGELALPPMVIDADGLKLMVRVDGWAAKIPPLAVLTPHPGEMAILTGLGIQQVQADRLGTAARYAREWGHVVVLKGANTVIAAPDGQVRVVPVATSALAHGGTGDVLAGMIAGLRAQGVPAFEAAVAGAWIHAQAGLLAAEQIGHEASVLAGDLIEALPEVLAWVW
ncbi:MAG TPA: NAD(P)H-hydrate dehydratase [Anaerolineaceae bacterium]